MRKALLIGLPVLALAAAGAAYTLLQPGDPVAAGKRRMARQDMRGAELYLRRAVRDQPGNAEAAFLLGQADLALGNAGGAELELKRARDHGYDPVAVLLPLGEAYLQQQHYTQVLHDFDPDHAPKAGRAAVLTIRAAAQLSLHDLTGAKTTIDQAEALAPTERDTLLTAGRIALASDDLQGAQTHADKVLEADPKSIDGLVLRAEIAMRRKDAKLALSCAQTVLASFPTRVDAQLLQARALAALGQMPAARAALDRVLRRAPHNIPANYLRVMLAVQAGDYAASDQSLTELNQVIDQLPQGIYFTAVTKLALGQTAQAEDAAARYLNANPDDPGGLKLMALVDLAEHHPDRAMALLQTSKLAANPDSDTLDLMGRAQAMQGQLRNAVKDFTQASALAPSDVRILNRLAAAQLKLGDAVAAEADLDRSLKLQPKQLLAGEAIVQAALARGDAAAANQYVERLRQQVGDLAEIGILAAQVKIAALDLDGAVTTLQDVLRRAPDNTQATLSLARIISLRGDEPGAEQLLQDHLSRQPADEAVLDVLLRGLYARHRIDDAVAATEAAHGAAPGNTSITASLADAYVAAGQPDRAAALLDRASAGSNPQLDLLRARILLAGHKPDLAERAFRATLQEAPADVPARIEMAAMLVDAKRIEDARAVLQDGLVQSPGNGVLLGAIVGLDFKQGGIAAALATAARLRAEPQNLPAANMLDGEAWLGAGDARKAAAAFTASYKTAPSGELAVAAAKLLAGTGDPGQAITILSGWTDTHPDDIDSQSLLSSLYISAGQLPQAADHLKAVLAVRRGDAPALNNLAWVQQQLGDMPGAQSLAQRAYFQSPQPDMADTLGWILARQGDTTRALPLLAQATTAHDAAERAAAQYHYGYALKQASHPDKARTELKLAVDASADFAGKDDARRLLASLTQGTHDLQPESGPASR